MDKSKEHNDLHIGELVKGFFHKIFEDAPLNNFFADHDRERFQHHPQTFYQHGFGENHYTNHEVAEAHKHLSVNEQHFESMVQHFLTTLSENGYSEEDQLRVREVLNGYKNDVIGKG